MKKILGFGALAVVVVIAAAVYFLASNLDSLVKAAIEDHGSKATGTQVRLAGVSLSPTSGEGTLSGFAMGNPKGFKTESAAKFGSVSVKVDIASSSPEKIIIREIAINAPDITYELAGSGSNFDAIQKHVESYTGGGGGSSSGGGDSGPKVIIDDFYIRGGTINVSAAILQGKALSTPLPDIHLTDIGKDEGGASPGEVAEEIIAEIRKRVNVGVSSLNLPELMGTAGKVLEGAAGTAGETVKTLGNAAGEGAEGVTGVLKKGAEGIGGFLDSVLPGTGQ